MAGWLWFTDDALTPKYTSAQIQALTGATKVDMQNWANRGLITPAAEKTGKGVPRRYTKFQVCVIAVCQWLRPLGLEASYAIDIAASSLGVLARSAKSAVRSGDRKHAVAKQVLETIALIERSDEGFVATATNISTGKASEIVNHVLSGKPALVVPIGLLVARVEAKEREASEAGA